MKESTFAKVLQWKKLKIMPDKKSISFLEIHTHKCMSFYESYWHYVNIGWIISDLSGKTYNMVKHKTCQKVVWTYLQDQCPSDTQLTGCDGQLSLC